MRKRDYCLCENKGADQLRSNCEADQRLCFGYSDSTIPLLLKSEISNVYLFSELVQVGLCRTWSETPKTGFLASRLIYSIKKDVSTIFMRNVSKVQKKKKTLKFKTCLFSQYLTIVSGELDWISEFKVKQSEKEKTSKIKVGTTQLTALHVFNHKFSGISSYVFA